MLNKAQEMEPSGAAFHAASLGEDGRKKFQDPRGREGQLCVGVRV